MLKIRISGTEDELRQIAHKAGSTRIRRFKRDNGKTSYAIDVQISVKDFLDNLDLSSQSQNNAGGFENTGADEKENYNPQDIQAELEDLLQEISDK